MTEKRALTIAEHDELDSLRRFIHAGIEVIANTNEDFPPDWSHVQNVLFDMSARFDRLNKLIDEAGFLPYQEAAA